MKTKAHIPTLVHEEQVQTTWTAFFSTVKRKNQKKNRKKILENGKNTKPTIQWLILQIESMNCIAMLSWFSLNGQLHLRPITDLQFCWRRPDCMIEDQGSKINSNPYKLSTLDSNQETQQAQKHPTSALKRIETLEIHRNPKFNRFQLGSYSKSSQTPPKSPN